MRKTEKIRAILDPSRPCAQEGERFIFPSGIASARSTAAPGFMGKVQDLLKRFGGLYYVLLSCLSPVMPSAAYRRTLSAMLGARGEDAVILNLGSGPARLKGRQDVINVDIFPFAEADVVADVKDVPLIDGCADLIVSVASLEHVADPARVVAEMRRLLKPGGELFCFVPFMQPFHAAPADFTRWTAPGCAGLFGAFDGVRVETAAGPTSGLLWVLQEWLAMTLSFGIAPLRDVLFLVLMTLTAPLKLLDLALERLPQSRNIASGFFIVASRKA